MSYRFYFRRAALFIATAAILFLAVTLLATALRISFPYAITLYYDLLAFVALAQFSKPLGLWRKSVCVATVFTTFCLLEAFLLSALGPTGIFSAIDSVLIIAALIGLYQGMKHWRRYPLESPK